MHAMAALGALLKLEAWEGWLAERGGARKAGLDDMNARLGLHEHRAFLQPLPDGSYLVLVMVEGPGADTFLASAGQSDHEFDRWFIASVSDLHGIDPTGPLPPLAAQR